MKLLTFILSCYIIALSCMPCADVEVVSVSQKVTASEHSDKHQDNDVCSPFCICNCYSCQGFTLLNTLTYNFIVEKTAIVKRVPEYRSIFSSDFYRSIWQPPKIS